MQRTDIPESLENGVEQKSDGERKQSAFYVAGVGASAGGLEALELLFKAMPADTGIAFVIIQHLSPDFKSLMDELLARHTAMPIHRAENEMEVKPNSIYLLPPKKEMIISGGRLLLTDKDPQQDLSLPIDHFFRSLAQDMGSRAIAVVLSGTGTDGSRGIRDVHEAGGLVIAQSEETAKFDGMPRSAVDTGVVDAALAPEGIPKTLTEYVNRQANLQRDDFLEQREPSADGVDGIFRLLREQYDIDFSHYKPNTVARRIERRLSMNQSVDLDDYVDRLRSDSGELNSLYRDLLIGVTRFFRDREAFDRLEIDIIPDLLAKKRAGEEVRIWVPGCATGEEPYSLAILVREQLQMMGRPINVKIFASDVHVSSLEIASAGVYNDEALAEVKPSRLNSYFSKKNDGYHVVPEIRQMIVFARHNVIKDAPFTKLDLISCRNLLIYFQPAAQKKTLSLFHFGLRTGGTLFLGPSESPGELTPEFETVDEHWKIYRKRRDIRLPPDMRLPLSNMAPHIRVSAPAPAALTLDAGLISAYDRVLDEYVPSGLLITDRRQLIHAFGGAGKYLVYHNGRPSTDILDLVNGDLKLALAGSLQRASKDLMPVVYTGVRLGTREEQKQHKLSVKPLMNRQGNLTHFFITIEDTGAAPPPVPKPATEIDVDEASKQHLFSLEAELRHTRENLQSTVEELETSNEELQASNEELVASNEELQSTNEELHSVNEELYTVNAEYQKKISELTEMSDDMNNLLQSTDVGTIFLDKNLCIRKFTPQVGRVFDLLPQDVGRKIDTFSHNIIYASLLEDVTTVLQTGEPIEKEVRHRHGNWLFLRILPYRTKAKLEGVVLTIIDISLLKRAEARLDQMSAIVSSSDDAIIGMDLDGRITSWNRGAERLYGFSTEEAVGKSSSILRADAQSGHGLADWPIDLLQRLRDGKANEPVEAVRRRKDGSLLDVMICYSPIRDSDATLTGVSQIARDITERKRTERALIRAEEDSREQVRQRDHFLAMLSHELRNPLAALVAASRLLEDGKLDRESVDMAQGTISRQAQHMARLLDDLLDVSRITRDRIEIRKRVVDVGQIARDALESIAPMLENRHVDLEVDLPSHPICVEADPARLQQIQVNLLSNAIKFTPMGGRIWVSWREEDDEAVFTVRDTGTGIPAQMRDKIFDLFVQLDQNKGTGNGGMGVGLTLVRALVRLHGGEVTVRSDGAGRGSEFTVRLPTCDPSRLPPARQYDRRALAGLSIVLIEDNADIRRVTQRVLKSFGCEMMSAESGTLGIEMVRQHCPEVALIDIGLPDVDGNEVARQIRRDPACKSVKLIALTGFGQPEDRAKAIEAGFDAHLVKPVNLDELCGMLCKVTKRNC